MDTIASLVTRLDTEAAIEWLTLAQTRLWLGLAM